jgi:hypothetical protein
MFFRHVYDFSFFFKNILLLFYQVMLGSLYVNYPSTLLPSNFMHIYI